MMVNFLPRSRYGLAFTLLLLGLLATACGRSEPTTLAGPERHANGAASAPVTLVTFDDYQ